MEKGYKEIVKPCPKCGSDDISIAGMAWIYVVCNVCHAESLGRSYGTRVERYCDTIEDWNNGNVLEH